MILTAVKMNKYNKYNFSEQCWSETVVLGVCYLGRGVSVVPAASVRSIQSLQRGRQAPPPVASSQQSPTPTPQRRLVPTAHLRRDERSDVRSTAQSEDGGRVSTAAVLTRAWKEDTEKTPRRPSMLLEGRLATARRLLGLGSSLPCRLDR